MTISLSDEQRRAIAIAEDITDVTVRDCVFDEEYDRVVFVIKTGEIGQAIGRDGDTVEGIESRLDREVTLVEDAPTPEGFVANALAPAAVQEVNIETSEGETVAFADVDQRDTGVAIGKDGRNIEMARRLVRRHFDIDNIELV